VTGQPAIVHYRIRSTPGTGPNTTSGFPTALATVIALVVAGLAAIGLTGESLLRAVRNHPVLISLCVGLAVLGAVIFVIAQLIQAEKPDNKTPIWIGVTVVGLGLISSVLVGAFAVGARERPSVTLQATPVAAAPSAASAGSKACLIELTITARAASLPTNNELMVQVIGLIEDPQRMARRKAADPTWHDLRCGSLSSSDPWSVGV
jgi:hypothetical protein